MPSAMPLLATAIRRDILAVLAGPDAPSMSAAGARVAAAWSERRRRSGLSVASARTAAALACGMALEVPPAARPPSGIRLVRGVRP
jgi:hypothetical protein